MFQSTVKVRNSAHFDIFAYICMHLWQENYIMYCSEFLKSEDPKPQNWWPKCLKIAVNDDSLYALNDINFDGNKKMRILKGASFR